MGGTDSRSGDPKDSRLEIDRAELGKLVDLYVRARYSPHPQDAGARTVAINAWLSLRRSLWLAWLRFPVDATDAVGAALGGRLRGHWR